MNSHAEAAGQVLLAGLAGTSLTHAERETFKRLPCVGVTLFRRNLSADWSEVVNLNQNIQQVLGVSSPAMIAIDQEGGRVARFKQPFPEFGPAFNLCEGAVDADAQSWIRRYGFAVGATLRGLGFNTNFAPVVDMNTNPRNPIIGNRAFGREVDTAVPRAQAFLQGMQAADVMGCLKHFPGQGDGGVDTHLGADRIDLGWQTLREREMAAFVPLLPQSPMVMMSHSYFPAVDAQPASLSKRWMQDILRGELGFQGLIVSDDMNMHAIAQDDAGWGEAIILAITHGADLILVCEHLARYEYAHEVITREASRNGRFAERLLDAARRTQSLRQKLKRPLTVA